MAYDIFMPRDLFCLLIFFFSFFVSLKCMRYFYVFYRLLLLWIKKLTRKSLEVLKQIA